MAYYIFSTKFLLCQLPRTDSLPNLLPNKSKEPNKHLKFAWTPFGKKPFSSLFKHLPKIHSCFNVILKTFRFLKNFPALKKVVIIQNLFSDVFFSAKYPILVLTMSMKKKYSFDSLRCLKKTTEYLISPPGALVDFIFMWKNARLFTFNNLIYIFLLQ